MFSDDYKGQNAHRVAVGMIVVVVVRKLWLGINTGGRKIRSYR